jgi:hypothetical protein
MDKSVAKFSQRILSLFSSLIILCRQIETESGNAVEQPVRDKFDLIQIVVKDCP